MSDRSIKRSVIALFAAVIMAFAAFAALAIFKASAYSDNFTAKDTAEIRVDGTGIRFTFNVKDGYAGELTNAGGEYEGYTASLGAAILPAKFLDGKELLANGKYIVSGKEQTPLIIDLVNKGKTESGYTAYNAVVTGIPVGSYEQELSARGFIKLVKDGAEDAYVYTEVTATRSIGYVATEAYKNAEGEEKSALERLLNASVGKTTLSFDKEEYAVTPQDNAAYKVYGNKYGYEITATASVKDENVARVEGKEIVGVSDGETEITVTVGEKTATAKVTVTGFTVTDSTGAFYWNYKEGISVVNGSKTYKNTTLINGTPNNPLTLNGYETYTAGEFVNSTGAVKLSEGLKLIEFAGTVINEAGNETTKITTTFTIRLTDKNDSQKVLDFEYRLPDWASPAYLGYFGYVYSNGTDGYSDNWENPMYGFNFGNTNAGVYNAPKLVYFGDYKFGYNTSAIDFADSKNGGTGANLAAKLASDNFGKDGVYLSVNSGSSGMMITDIAKPKIIEQDATGAFSYVKGSATVAAENSESKKGYNVTAKSGAKIYYNQTIDLGALWTSGEDKDTADYIIRFNPVTTKTINKIIVRFTDAYDESKGIAIAMVNTAGTDVGWGDSAATYIRGGNVDDGFTDDFGGWTAVGNDYVRLGSATADFSLKYDTENRKFYVALDDGYIWHYQIKSDAITENPFSDGNIGGKVKVSVEFVSNSADASVFFTRIGNDFFATT